MYSVPDDPMPTTVRDYMGKAYSFRHHLDDGHQPWSLKALESTAGATRASSSLGSGVRAADFPSRPAGLPCTSDVNRFKPRTESAIPSRDSIATVKSTGRRAVTPSRRRSCLYTLSHAVEVERAVAVHASK